MSGHTPTPWVLEPNDMLFTADGFIIGDLRFLATPNNRANAAFIVKAVNSHAANEAKIEALVKALSEVEAICTESNSDCRKRMGTRVGNCLVAARAALSAAAGER